MSQVKRKVTRKAKLSKADREMRILARTKFKPWKKEHGLHPSIEEWKAYNNTHAVTLRCGYATMTLTKEQIVSGFGQHFEDTKKLIDCMVYTKEWLNAHAQMLDGAMARLLSGLAAAELQREKKTGRAA